MNDDLNRKCLTPVMSETNPTEGVKRVKLNTPTGLNYVSSTEHSITVSWDSVERIDVSTAFLAHRCKWIHGYVQGCSTRRMGGL